MHKALKDTKESFKNTSKAKKTLESKKKKKGTLLLFVIHYYPFLSVDKAIESYQQQYEQLQVVHQCCPITDPFYVPY